MSEKYGADDVPDIEFDLLARTIAADRYFFYDCLPSEADEQTAGQQQSSARSEWHRRQIENVRSRDRFWLKLGTLSRGRRRQPAQQKEVDVLLTVELLSFSFSRPGSHAVLFMGDLDFRPAIEEIVRHGTQVTLFFDATGCSSELLETVDFRRAMNVQVYFDWTPPSFQTSHAEPRVVAVGPMTQVDSRTVLRTAKSSDGRYIQCIAPNPNGPNRILRVENTPRGTGFTDHCFTQDSADYVFKRYIPKHLGDVQWPVL